MIDKVFNKYKNKFITLEKGEEFCKKCKGKGKVLTKFTPFLKKSLICNECLGDGKIDWIEKITGKPKTSCTDETDTDSRCR